MKFTTFYFTLAIVYQVFQNIKLFLCVSDEDGNISQWYKCNDELINLQQCALLVYYSLLMLTV